MNVDIQENIPTVQIDIVRFNQVINNLISNAIKFTDNRSVTVKIRMDNETENSINLTTQIIDTGIGLTKEQQAVIFNAFTQATESTTRLYGGTRLGLSIVKKFIAAMNTEIHIDSNVGFGSNFYFKLNSQKAQNNIENTVDIKKQHQLKGKKYSLLKTTKSTSWLENKF